MAKKTELDKLDIDKIIEEIKEEDVKEEKPSAEKSEPPENKEEKSEKKEKISKKKVIFFAVWGVLLIFNIIMAYFAYKEKTKKIYVKSAYFKINPKIIYLSKEKKEQAEIEKTYKNYNFNLEIAYEFNGVYSKKILSCQVTCTFKSKYHVELKRLYAYIKRNIFNDFKKLTNGKFLEEIKDYNSKLSLIIENNIINSIVKFCPDVDKNKLKKSLNFVVYRIV